MKYTHFFCRTLFLPEGLSYVGKIPSMVTVLQRLRSYGALHENRTDSGNMLVGEPYRKDHANNPEFEY